MGILEGLILWLISLLLFDLSLAKLCEAADRRDRQR